MTLLSTTRRCAYVGLFIVFNWKIALVASIIIALIYQRLIAKFYGVMKMPSMDLLCLLGTKEAPCNILSICYVKNPVNHPADKPVDYKAKAHDNMRFSMKNHFKMRS